MNGVTVDRLSGEVLAELSESGEELTTSELSGRLGVDNNTKMWYRFDKLEDAGLIEVDRGSAGAGPGRMDPNTGRLTEEGEEIVERFDLGGGFVDDGTRKLRRELEEERRERRQLENRTEELEERLNEFIFMLSQVNAELGWGIDYDDEAW